MSELNIVRYHVSKILLYIFLFACVLTPRDYYNIKIFSCGLLLLINIDVIYLGIKKRKYSAIFFFSILFPLVLFFVSLVMNGNASVRFQISYVYSYFYLLIFYIVKKHDFDFLKIFLLALRVMATIMVVSVCLDMINILPLSNNDILKWLYNKDEAMIRFDRNGAFGYFIYLKASVLLCFGCLYSLSNKKYLQLLFFSIAVFLSGTRANIYFIAIAIVIYEVLFIKNTNFKTIFLLFLALGGVLLGPKIGAYIIESFVIKAGNDQIRLGDISSIFILLRDNPQVIFFGMGFGANFYSLGRHEIVQNIELSYLDLLRQIGMISFSIFCAFLIIPILKMKVQKKDSWLLIAYLCFLAIAATNPLLTGSTAYVVYNLIYIESFKRSDCKE